MQPTNLHIHYSSSKSAQEKKCLYSCTFQATYPFLENKFYFAANFQTFRFCVISFQTVFSLLLPCRTACKVFELRCLCCSWGFQHDGEPRVWKNDCHAELSRAFLMSIFRAVCCHTFCSRSQSPLTVPPLPPLPPKKKIRCVKIYILQKLRKLS